MTITHIAMFQFKDSATASILEKFNRDMLALKDTSIHPKTGEKYVLSVKGGFDGNPVKHQHGITHAFVLEFSSVDDWRYYIDSEPAHWAIVKDIKEVLNKVQTVDFEDGVFSGSLRA